MSTITVSEAAAILGISRRMIRVEYTPAALSLGQRPQHSSQCGAGQCHHARHGNRLAGGAADSRAIRLNGGRGHVQQLSGGTHGQSHVRLPSAEFSRRHACPGWRAPNSISSLCGVSSSLVTSVIEGRTAVAMVSSDTSVPRE